MTDPHPQHRPRLGFTLTEVVVVMGIIVLLMGLVLAAVLHALKAGKRSRVQADFQTISLALEAYKADFGDYPRFINDPSKTGTLGDQWDWNGHRGAELLCRALIGSGPAFANPPVTPGSAVDNSGADGAGAGGSGDSTTANSQASGPGFRTRSGLNANGKLQAQGKIWGPYVSPDKFRVYSLSTTPGLATVIGSTTAAGTVDATAVLLDSQGHTILYFPAAQTMPDFTKNTTYLADYLDPKALPSPVPPYLYNSFDNCSSPTFVGGVPPDPLNNPFITAALKESDFYQLLGADPMSGQIPSGGTPIYTGPYILWSAGADGNFGLSSDGKSDDITNFDFPLQLRK